MRLVSLVEPKYSGTNEDGTYLQKKKKNNTLITKPQKNKKKSNIIWIKFPLKNWFLVKSFHLCSLLISGISTNGPMISINFVNFWNSIVNNIRNEKIISYERFSDFNISRLSRGNECRKQMILTNTEQTIIEDNHFVICNDLQRILICTWACSFQI